MAEIVGNSTATLLFILCFGGFVFFVMFLEDLNNKKQKELRKKENDSYLKQIEKFVETFNSGEKNLLFNGNVYLPNEWKIENNNDGILSSVLINLESKKFLRVTDIYKERHQFIDIKKEN